MSTSYTFRAGAPRKQRLREPLSYKKRRNLEEDRVRLMSLKRILKLKKSQSRERWKLEQILAAGCTFF
jgi:hypothetical protein